MVLPRELPSLFARKMEGFHGNLGVPSSSLFVEIDLDRNGRTPSWNLTGWGRAESGAPGIAQKPEEFCCLLEQTSVHPHRATISGPSLMPLCFCTRCLSGMGGLTPA